MRNGRFPDQRRRPDDYGTVPPAESSDEVGDQNRRSAPSHPPSDPSAPGTEADGPWPFGSWPTDYPEPDYREPDYPEPAYPESGTRRQRQSPYSFPPARSALGLRRVLALFGLVVCGVAAGWFVVVGWLVPAALLALLALVAVVDLVVIQHRLHSEHRLRSESRPRRQPRSRHDRR